MCHIPKWGEMKKPIAPCYKCEERHIGCHSTCERYQAYAGIVAESREERREFAEKQTNSRAKLSQTELRRRNGH